MNRRKVKKIPAVIAMAFCFSFCAQKAAAQTVQTFIDKQDILIGEQLKYKVVATAPAGVFSVQWLTVPDSMPHFELVEKSKIDTSADNGNTVYKQTLTLTSFDSGRWTTPAFAIHFNPNKESKALTVLTDSFAVNVGFAAADSTNELRDIKPIMDVAVKDYFWYYIGAGVLLSLLILAVFLWLYFKRRNKLSGQQFRRRMPAYNEAMQELEKLKQLNLQLPEDIKLFHTKLAAVFKWYFSRVQRKSSMNRTTGDVLVHLSDNDLPKEIIMEAATALRVGDAVKFAKYLPSPGESNECLDKIKATIHFINRPAAHNQQSIINNQ